jgi:hypothetical protein
MRLGVVILILLPFSVFGQSESSQRRIQSLGIVFAPEFGYRSLNYASSHEWVEVSRDETEVGNYGFTTGVKVRLRSKRTWRLETGLLFANKSFKTRNEELIWTSDDPALPQSTKTIYRLKYLSLPINIHYPLMVKNRLTLAANGGLSANVFLSAKTKVIIGYGDGHETSHASVKQVGHSRFSLSGLIGATVDYKLSDKFVITAEPHYQRFLTSINADNNAKEHLYSFGIGLAASYVF